MRVSYSKRPLLVEELCHALGVEIGSTDLSPQGIPAIRTLLSCCLGLLTLEVSSSTVRLVHFTLQEHLLSASTIFRSPHSTIAEVCLTYLNFGSVRDLSPTVRCAPSTMPLLQYASLYWGEHTRRGMTTENVGILALRLLERFDKHISAQLLLLMNEEYSLSGPGFTGEQGPVGFTGLHGGAYLGIMELLVAVLEMKEWDVNARDCTGSTALTWAAYKGHEEVVKMLLEREDVNPDQADTKHSQTPLLLAAQGGHEGIVKALLERKDVNPDRADTKYGWTPLSWAAERGHEGIVKMLLERREVNPDPADTSGRTPLFLAVRGGHEGVVVILERGDVNADKAEDGYGRTPLFCAAQGGHEGVVNRLLRRRDVNPNQSDTYMSQTPLLLAARGGHQGIVKILFGTKGGQSRSSRQLWQNTTLVGCSGRA